MLFVNCQVPLDVDEFHFEMTNESEIAETCLASIELAPTLLGQ